MVTDDDDNDDDDDGGEGGSDADADVDKEATGATTTTMMIVMMMMAVVVVRMAVVIFLIRTRLKTLHRCIISCRVSQAVSYSRAVRQSKARFGYLAVSTKQCPSLIRVVKTEPD